MPSSARIFGPHDFSANRRKLHRISNENEVEPAKHTRLSPVSLVWRSPLHCLSPPNAHKAGKAMPCHGNLVDEDEAQPGHPLRKVLQSRSPRGASVGDSMCYGRYGRLEGTVGSLLLVKWATRIVTTYILAGTRQFTSVSRLL